MLADDPDIGGSGCVVECMIISELSKKPQNPAHMLPGEFHLKVECVTKTKTVLQTELYDDSYEINQRVPTGGVIIQITK